MTLRKNDGGVALRSPTPLATRLDGALRAATERDDETPLLALVGAEPTGTRDAMAALAAVHGLDMAPLERLDGTERWQHHPALGELRWRLEARLVDHLDELADELVPCASAGDADDAAEAVAALRRLARLDAVPEVYRWLAEEATYEQVVHFLALEGGPDGGFDDLVALSQVGLSGEAKLELARNYWDEMGRGRADEVHTELHRRLSAALELPRLDPLELPEAALVRGVTGSFLALSRRHQPEALGAFGLVELQAGPRCRWVLRALERVGAPTEAVPFYAEHAEADPRHGKDWLDHAVAELATDRRWAEGIVRGARWRAAAGMRFFADVLLLVAGDRRAAGGVPVRPRPVRHEAACSDARAS